MNRFVLVVLAALVLASAGILVVHSRTSQFVTDNGRVNHHAVQRALNGAEP